VTIIYTPASNVFTRGDYATGSGGHHSPASAGARVRARLTDLLLQHRSHVQKRKARQARARPRAGKRDRESVGSPPPSPPPAPLRPGSVAWLTRLSAPPSRLSLTTAPRLQTQQDQEGCRGGPRAAEDRAREGGGQEEEGGREREGVLGLGADHQVSTWSQLKA